MSAATIAGSHKKADCPRTFDLEGSTVDVESLPSG
jgi:hypothetical protein